MKKETSVSTIDYYKEEFEDCESDEEGNLVRYGDVEISYDNVDFESEYKSQHYTPIELIGILKTEMERNLQVHPEQKGAKSGYWQHIIDECADWVEDDEIVDMI